MKHVQSPIPYFHFSKGAARFTVISDGEVISGRPSVTHPRPEGEVDAFLTASFLPLDRLVFAANVLIVELGSRRIMFDAGLGLLPEKPAWGEAAGLLLDHLALAEIDPTSIDDIILTHGHGEHVAGLTDAEGTLNFPNARIHIFRAEYDFWTDPDKTGPDWVFDHQQALKNLKKHQSRISFIADGDEVVPGVTAFSTPGHTVGHMSYFVETGAGQLCVMGDLARHYLLNIERPDWEFVGDFDRKLTVRSRRTLLDLVARERIPVISYHFPWPGLGHVGKTDTGFRYYPLTLDLVRGCVL